MAFQEVMPTSTGGHPGLGEDFLEGILIAEVFPTSFRPQVVEDKTT